MSAADFGGALATRLGRRFAAGPTVGDALDRVAALQAEGVRVTCEYVAHPARTAGDADAALTTVVEFLDGARERGLAHGGDLDLTLTPAVLGDGVRGRARLAVAAAAAEAAGTGITLHPTAAAEVDGVIAAATTLRAQHPDTGVELWSVLRRTAGDVARAVAAGAPAHPPRLVLRPGPVGGTVPAAVALPGPTDADRAFLRSAKRLLAGPARVSLVAQDATLAGIVEALADARAGASADGSWWELQADLGRRPDELRRWVAAGRRVRVRVPFGPRWRTVGVGRSVPALLGRPVLPRWHR